MADGLELPGWGVIVGGIAGTFTALWGGVVALRKGKVDESVALLTEWKKIVDQHQADIKEMKEEFAEYRKTATSDLEFLRQRVVELERELREVRGENGELRADNDGLRRSIAANSQSSAFALDPAAAKARAPTATRRFGITSPAPAVAPSDMIDKLDKLN